MFIRVGDARINPDAIILYSPVGDGHITVLMRNDVWRTLPISVEEMDDLIIEATGLASLGDDAPEDEQESH